MTPTMSLQQLRDFKRDKKCSVRGYSRNETGVNVELTSGDIIHVLELSIGNDGDGPKNFADFVIQEHGLVRSPEIVEFLTDHFAGFQTPHGGEISLPDLISLAEG